MKTTPTLVAAVRILTSAPATSCRGGRTRTAALVALALGLAPGCSERQRVLEQSWEVMGTFASIQASAGDSDRVGEYAAAAREAFSDTERRMSIFNPASEISRLNSAPRGTLAELSPSSAAVMELALGAARLSGGAFDPTVGPLMDIWGFRSVKRDHPPSEAEIQGALARVGFAYVRMQGILAAMDLQDGRVDLGGVAKGCAVDVAFDRITSAGASNVLINLGGNMRCAGHGSQTGAWTVGVRDPFNNGRVLGTLKLTGGMAVATSGHYEKFVTFDGRRYAHIMDPRSGRPVSGMAGVTVVSPKAGDADVLSTSLFVLGPEAGEKMLASFPGSYALFVPDEQPIRLIMTPGFERFFTPSPLEKRP